MARPIGGRVQKLDTFQPVSGDVPGFNVHEMLYWSPPKGMNTIARLNRMPMEYATLVENLMLAKGYLKSRPGTQRLGSNSPSPVMGIIDFHDPSGVGYLIRLRTDGADLFDGIGSWDPIPDLTFTGSVTDLFSVAGWGAEILLSNGVDKVVAYAPVTGVVEVIEESVPAKHITVFGGRLVLSAVVDPAFLGYRSRWSAKNDNRDFTGIGSGYEDFFATPGGEVDEVMGWYPITDEIAYVVRESSVWQVTQTGDPDAPFRPTKLYSKIGSRSRHAIKLTPNGLMMLGKDDIYELSGGPPRAFGEPVRSTIFDNLEDPEQAVAEYNEDTDEFLLAVKEGTATVPNVLWRYSDVDKGWTRSIYPFGIRNLRKVTALNLAIAIDALEGTIDGLVGTIDEQVRAFEQNAVHFAVDGNNYVMTSSDDLTTDENNLGVLVDSEIKIETALLQDGSRLHKTQIIRARLEYEATKTQNLIFEWTTDGGATWTTYSIKTVGVTTGPAIIHVERTLISYNLRIRVRSLQLGGLSLIGLTLDVLRADQVD